MKGKNGMDKEELKERTKEFALSIRYVPHSVICIPKSEICIPKSEMPEVGVTENAGQ